MQSKQLVVAIKHSQLSGNFFIDFSNEAGYIVSVKIAEGVAISLAKELGLKIMIG